MNDVEKFLVHAIALERDAARRYEDLAAAMRTDGNTELSEFFALMARYSRMHLAEAQARGGFRELPVFSDDDWEWPDGLPPETAEWAGVDAMMDARSALEVALAGERRGHAYYAAISAATLDPELRRIAGDFADEEAQHVAQLEKLLAAQPAS